MWFTDATAAAFWYNQFSTPTHADECICANRFDVKECNGCWMASWLVSWQQKQIKWGKNVNITECTHTHTIECKNRAATINILFSYIYSKLKRWEKTEAFICFCLCLFLLFERQKERGKKLKNHYSGCDIRWLIESRHTHTPSRIINIFLVLSFPKRLDYVCELLFFGRVVFVCAFSVAVTFLRWFHGMNFGR